MVNKVLLLGDVLIDVSLKANAQTGYKLRFGGIIHAARCLWALGVDYDVAYFSPDYLDKNISDQLTYLNCKKKYKLGNVTGSPYAILIEELKEIGSQGYEFLLRDEIDISYDEANLKAISDSSYTDILIISGNYSLKMISHFIPKNAKIHIDPANNINTLESLKLKDFKFETIFLSTSSELFKNYFENNFKEFGELFYNVTNQLILKENRGGSRGIDYINSHSYTAPSQTQPIVHSVGVGDVYDVAFLCTVTKLGFRESMVFASWIAVEYATTTFPLDFKNNVLRIRKTEIRTMIELGGVQISWEDRQSINIYIAAPDFSYMDVTPINSLHESLLYHNFKPRRPILENGLMEDDATYQRKQELFQKDMQLIEECQMMVVVLLNNDPGTLIELGIAKTKGMPCVVFDPYNIATNCMLTQIPDFISSDMDEIVSEVFIMSSKIINEKN